MHIIRMVVGVIVIAFLPGLGWQYVLLCETRFKWSERLVLIPPISVALLLPGFFFANLVFKIPLNGIFYLLAPAVLFAAGILCSLVLKKRKLKKTIYEK